MAESDVLVGENCGCVIPKAFADKLEEQVQETGKFPVLTINARGDLIGDISAIPAEMLEKLQTPEAREQMRAMYRKEFGSGRRELRRVVAVKQEQRDFRELCPPGMSSKEFRKLRRQHFRAQTKAVLKEMRHGRSN